MSLRSVPDGRSPVPMVWWVPAVTLVVLAATTVVVVTGREILSPWVAVGASIAGYGLVWWRIRPARLRTGPYTWLTTAGLARDRVDPPTLVIPSRVIHRTRRPGRATLLLVSSAAVGLGLSFSWSLVIGLLLRPPVPDVGRALTVTGGLFLAVLDSAVTSVLEECGMALLILGVAGVAQRYLPRRYDERSVAVWAVLAATAARTALHVPLWGIGAIGRLGLSLILAWLFWRTRRVWPLILGHILWDTLALQTALSPSLAVNALSALAAFGWGIAGTVIAIIAIVHTRQDIRCANHYYQFRAATG